MEFSLTWIKCSHSFRGSSLKDRTSVLADSELADHSRDNFSLRQEMPVVRVCNYAQELASGHELEN